MKLLGFMIACFVTFMVGVIIWPMYKTDWVVLSIARQATLGMPLSELLDQYPGYTWVHFKGDGASDACLTLVNASGKLRALPDPKGKRKVPTGDVVLSHEWDVSGRCKNVTVVYESLYRKGYVYFSVDDNLKMTVMPTTSSYE